MGSATAPVSPPPAVGTTPSARASGNASADFAVRRPLPRSVCARPLKDNVVSPRPASTAASKPVAKEPVAEARIVPVPSTAPGVTVSPTCRSSAAASSGASIASVAETGAVAGSVARSGRSGLISPSTRVPPSVPARVATVGTNAVPVAADPSTCNCTRAGDSAAARARNWDAREPGTRRAATAASPSSCGASTRASRLARPPSIRPEAPTDAPPMSADASSSRMSDPVLLRRSLILPVSSAASGPLATFTARAASVSARSTSPPPRPRPTGRAGRRDRARRR